MWWLIAFLPAVLSIVIGCAKERQSVHNNKSHKSSKSQKSNKSKSASKKSGKSSKSRKGKSSKSGKSGKSKKSGKSGKSKSNRSESRKSKKEKKPTDKSAKSSKSAKTAKPIENAALPPAFPAAITVVEAEPLRTEPQQIAYKATGGLQSFTVINPGKERRAFKVKCSDNQLYRVNPVYGYVEPGQNARIDVLRHNGAAKLDKLVVFCAPVAGNEPKEAFSAEKSMAPNQQTLTLPLVAEA